MRRPGFRPSTAGIPSGRHGGAGLARRESGYVRNGTVSIVAVLQIAAGQVITDGLNPSRTYAGLLSGRRR